MGFVRRKTYDLRFGDPSLGGLQVSIRACDVGTMLEVRTLSRAGFMGLEEANEHVQRMITILTEHLVGWNLETEDGQPVPATEEGLRRQDRELLAEIVTTWRDAVEGVSAPLLMPSPSGGMSAVASIPMETLSEDLAS